jgi:hypothetical protein
MTVDIAHKPSVVRFCSGRVAPSISTDLQTA